MLRPEPMTRVLVVGPKDQLERVIETLYGLKLVHLVDHRGEEDGIGIGKPLPRAAEVSENLVKLRSIANLLNVAEAERPEEGESLGDIRGQIVTLELNLREEDESRKKIEGLLQDLNRQIEELRPFAALGLPLEAYRGYDSLEVLVGRVTDEVEGLASVTPEFELVAREDLVAVFVAKANADRVREHLARFGFSPIEIPKGEGNPQDLLSRAEAERQKWSARLAEIQERIAKLRDRYAKFIVRAEDVLQVEVEKAEAPLRFATSDHSFVADGWVPSSRVDALESALQALPGLHVEILEEVHGHEAEEEAPPVLLRHRGPVKRFEFLTNLYSTPQHDELDPTAFLFLLFPVFFGLMIGDAGYGLVMIVLGFLLSWKLKDSKDFADLMRVVLYGGIFAYAFGLLLYGEMFGIPFHAPPSAPEEISWSAILQYNIPYDAPIHKLEKVGVIDMLLLAVIASAIHLGLGYVVGFVNEWTHSKRHAIAKVGWFLILIGFLSFFAVLGRTPEWCATAPTLDCANAAGRVANRLFLDQAPLAWIPATGVALGALTLPYFMLGCMGVGAALLIVGEPMGALEIISLLSNMMSYTRLAGVAVAKGAVALAFNTMLLPLIINEEAFHATGVVEWNPSPVFIVVGFILLFLAHAIVLILGGVSAGIQSIRLNYVEFFLKFYRGGGKLFSPFGARKTKTEV
ncbi:MAG TPA: V-type ATP synthase subunit I [Thermoplasmata archaeon]|jgi:V/A-type H+-transporting ATPase subunit I|nr:V-type ATP synthase subunit I [Thermoplasmata archaeon]